MLTKNEKAQPCCKGCAFLEYLSLYGYLSSIVPGEFSTSR